MWNTFFETLGAEIVLSPPTTTRAILADDASRLVVETCLPVKVFCRHAASLAESCDYLLEAFVNLLRRRRNKAKRANFQLVRH